ncbi:Protein CHLOROPLAST IMPORT APPARATUS 2 [Acorus calamus]|uniref:Protein CHLOROPLAST IMPORT APPARATUS 2 n=1 Tax=Acorus calamus TaxID=4465 RepID=A0AAV9EL22_ACOCL|nr:Protein CHLOROPLAST IMPORT APPARATUS 2 [Acorus calamus]
MNQQQLDLFPIHRDYTYHDDNGDDNNDDDELSSLFDQDYDAGTPDLQDLLGCQEGLSSSSSSSSSTVSSCYTTGGSCMGDRSLARAALRGREWEVFFCSEGWRRRRSRALSLKLDYKEIIDAWSDRGSLYIDGEGPQTVPVYEGGSAASGGADVFMDVGYTKNCALWSVPEMTTDVYPPEEKSVLREARVLRYKEKRQSRLFPKKIRYEVRKLNAEKRPRLKGRFVKRKDDV